MLSSVEVKVLDARIGKEFSLPKYGSELAAGIDIVACLDGQITIKPGDAFLVPLGIAVSINDRNYAMFLMPRSGSAHKLHLSFSNAIGLIDADYQGQLFASARNISNKEDLVINPGDRIGQMVFTQVFHPEFKFVEEFSNETERGAGGFGSTGTK